MRTTELYVVTGVSGRTGAAAARTLLEAGLRVRVVVREAAKGNFWVGQEAEVAVADLADLASLTKALSGADGAYIVSPPQYATSDLFARAETMANVIANAAVEAQLPKLVALSSIGADRPDHTGWIAMNRMLELRLGRTGLPVTFLRAAYFMENWGPMLGTAVTQGVLPSFLAPLERKLPMIATADIGHFAAEVLREDWRGVRAIELEGPSPYSPKDVADAITHALKKPVHAFAIPAPDWVGTLSPQGFSAEAIAGFVEMTQGLNSGHIAWGGDSNTERRRGKTSLKAVITALLRS